MIRLNRSKENGSALVFVLIMIVLLGLWFAGLATLTQSSAAAVKTNANLALARQAEMQGAFVSAMSQISARGALGTDQNTDAVTGLVYRCNSSGDPLAGGLTPYSPYPNDPDPIKRAVRVSIDCTQIAQSGKSAAAAASFALVGPSASCSAIGSDCGLKIQLIPGASDPCSTTQTPDLLTSTVSKRLGITGGILNSSGLWDSVDCLSMALLQPTSSSAPPFIKTPTCPSSWYRISPKGSNFEGKNVGTSVPGQSDCTEVTSASLNASDSSTDIGAYMLNMASSLDDVSGLAKFKETGDQSADCTKPVTGTTDLQGVPTGSWKFIQVLPGIVNSTMIASLTTLTTTNACNTTALVFTPGVYRFVPDAAPLTATWTLGSGATVIGGKPSYSSLTVPNGSNFSFNTNLKPACSTSTNGQGVQFQLSGRFQMVFGNTGKMILCGDALGKPVISAPTQALSNAAGLGWYSSPAGALISTGGGAANECGLCVGFKGLALMPAGSVQVEIKGDSYVGFEGGAVLKAFFIKVGGSVSTTSSVAPPPPSVGDRVVQLRFRSSSLGDLGVVQVVIKDYFGRRLSSGYKIIGWRAAW